MEPPKIYHPAFHYFRGRRARQFLRLFRVNEATHILDVGGTPGLWSYVPFKPRVVLLNLLPHWPVESPFSCIQADGRRLPFRDQSFDVVVCSSLIEHVGGPEQQARLAAEIRRVGRAYYVQTPNRGFFLEAHTLTPFFHFLPKRSQRALVRHFTVRSLFQRFSEADADELTYGIRLLGRRELASLFPDSELVPERFLGMTKSWIVVRRMGAAGERRADPDTAGNGARLMVAGKAASYDSAKSKDGA